MGLKQFSLSLLLGVAGGFVAFFLAWGLFTTHPELGMGTPTARAIGLWASPIVFLGSLIYFSVKIHPRS